MQIHKIELTQYKRDKVAMFYNSTPIGISSEPLFEAARFLLSEGKASHDDIVETYRGETKCMSAKVGIAATKTVKEDRLGIRIVEYSASPYLSLPVKAA